MLTLSLFFSVSAQFLSEINFQYKKFFLPPKTHLVSFENKDTTIKISLIIELPDYFINYYHKEILLIAHTQKFNFIVPNILYTEIDTDSSDFENAFTNFVNSIAKISFDNNTISDFITNYKKNYSQTTQSSKNLALALAFNFYGSIKPSELDAVTTPDLVYVYNNILASSNFYFFISSQHNFDTLTTNIILKNFSNINKNYPNSHRGNNYMINKNFLLKIVTTNDDRTFVNVIYNPSINQINPTNYYKKLILQQILIEKLNAIGTNYKTNFESQLFISPNFNYFQINFLLNDPVAYDIITLTKDATVKLAKNNFLFEEFEEAKKKLIDIFSKNKTFQIQCLTIFKTLSNNLPLDFFTNISQKISAINFSDCFTLPPLIDSNNLQIVIFSKYSNTLCDAINLAEDFKIEYFDQKLNKFKIIPKKFNASKIINDYLTHCRQPANYSSIFINFESQYSIDTTYKLIGSIFSQKNKIYIYQTNMILKTDTLLHSLKLATKNTFIDSNAIELKFLNKTEFWENLTTKTVFPELFYSRWQWTPSIVCDTALQKLNIYKIKVSTNTNLIIYDYYDYNKKTKIRSEILKPVGIKFDTLAIFEYYDFKPIAKNSDAVLPFKIVEKFPNYTVTTNISSIQINQRIPKKFSKIKIPNR